MGQPSPPLLSVDEALRAVLERAVPLPPKRLPAVEALGCILAQDATADLDLPPFDKALVDGYAVRAADLAGGVTRLSVGEEILAGRTPTRPLALGEAAIIMTGAPLPEGADAVVMVEQTVRRDGVVEFDPAYVVAGQNRLLRGREFRQGETILERGVLLNPARLGLLASVGLTEVDLLPRPRVLVVPTGDELVEPSQVPGPGQIRNSNAIMLETLASSEGGESKALPIAPDDPRVLAEALSRGLTADILIVAGGVSAGAKDLVPGTLERLGVECVFHKIRVRPGKPLWFGVGPPRGDAPGTLVFGLPGNPVSGIVSFLLFVRPALRALAGRQGESAERSRYPLARSFVNRRAVPTYFPARLIAGPNGPRVDTLDWAGSADLRTVANADGFALFAEGDAPYDAGAVVDFLNLG